MFINLLILIIQKILKNINNKFENKEFKFRIVILINKNKRKKVKQGFINLNNQKKWLYIILEEIEFESK